MASYEQDPKTKMWSVRFRETVDGVQKNKRLRGFKLKKDAQEAYRLYVNEAQEKKQTVSSNDLTFDDLCKKYLDHQEKRLKYSSYYDVKKSIEKHIIPFFGEMKVKDVTPLHIANWIDGMEGNSFSFRKNMRSRLGAIFRFGSRYYDVINITEKLEPLRNLEKKKEMLYWTKEEFTDFIQKCDDPLYNLFFRFLYITGCRKGEALALGWEDFDFQDKTVKIDKSVTPKAKNNAYAITTPKNVSSNRVIDLPDSFVNSLIFYKKEQSAKRFVFGGEDPISRTTIDRKLAFYANKAGVKKIRVHDFRHSCASLLISEGVSIVAVSKRLGHANIEQTLNTYSHMMPKDQDIMLQCLDGL